MAWGREIHNQKQLRSSNGMKRGMILLVRNQMKGSHETLKDLSLVIQIFAK